MAWKNTQYRGPDIMTKLMRTTNIPWQQKSIRNEYLISNAQHRERFKPSSVRWTSLFETMETDEEKPAFGEVPAGKIFFGDLGERELRNLHSQSSSKKSGALEAPNSKYVSMTSSMGDTNCGEGANRSIIFRFDIWRSDVWKGKHEISRDPQLVAWLAENIYSKPLAMQAQILQNQTPPDWDRGMEFEWLALGGTKIYHVEESEDGRVWANSVPTKTDIDFWWEALE